MPRPDFLSYFFPWRPPKDLPYGPDVHGKKNLLNLSAVYLALPVLLASLAYNFSRASWPEAICQSVIIIALTVAVLGDSRANPPAAWPRHRVMLLWLCMVLLYGLFLFMAGHRGQTSILLWGFLLPHIAFYALGMRASIFWVTAFLAAACWLIFTAPPTGSVELGPLLRDRLRFVVTLVINTVGAAVLYHIILSDYHRRGAEQKQLDEFYLRTEQEVLSRRQREKLAKKDEEQDLQSHKLETLGALASGVAHDFNNILGAMMGYTDLAITQLDSNHPSQQHLDQVLIAGHRAADLVRQLLSVSRSEAPAQGVLEMSKAVREAVNFMKGALPGKVELISEIRAHGPVKTESARVHQVVINLIKNAARAMGSKGGLVRVALDRVKLPFEPGEEQPKLKPGLYFRLTVSDNGKGMDESILKHIFEPYFTTRGQGAGIGLAVVYGSVTGMGGAVLVKSKVGQGSRFEVFLPVTEKQAAAPQAKAQDENIVGNERLMFVDDEEMLARLGSEALESLGYQVDGFTSGRQALEAFKADPDGYDLIITDLAMPVLPGDRLVKEMLAIDPRLPIIMCTGFSGNLTPEQASEIGVRRVIYKPLLVKDLALAVRQVLDGEPGR